MAWLLLLTLMTDWNVLADRVQRATTTKLGVEVAYTRAGSDPLLLRGVFNGAFLLERLVDGLQVARTRPVLGVRLADLPAGGAQRGDQVTVGPIGYQVAEIEQDGEGGALLIMEKT